LKIQKGLLSGKSTLLRYVCLMRNDAGVTNVKIVSQQCPWHFIRLCVCGNAVQRSGAKWDEMPRVNCIKTYSDGVQLGLTYASHLWSPNVLIQLTHSMLPLSLLILGVYTCSIYRWSLDKVGTSIDTYEGYMSRDNGSEICNIECTSINFGPSLSILVLKKEEWMMKNDNDELIDVWSPYCKVSWNFMNQLIENSKYLQNRYDTLNGDQDLYSHQYGLGISEWYISSNINSNIVNKMNEEINDGWNDTETIKTISNTVNITKNIIIKDQVECATMNTILMIIFCIRDSLREYKSNYVILSSMKLALYNWLILSESAIFNLLFWSSYTHILSPFYITINLWISNIQLNSYDLSLKNTNLLSISWLGFTNQLIFGHILSIMYWYLCSYGFQILQMIEFLGLSINMNDTLLGWNFYNIDGWHLYHIAVGNSLLWMLMNNDDSCWKLDLKWIAINVRIRVMKMFWNMQLVYWHFVELLWLFIYYVLYT
jgi:cytochrome c oxidase subunit 3